MVTLAKFEITKELNYNILSWDFTPDSIIDSGSTMNFYRSENPGNIDSLYGYETIASGISPLVRVYNDTTVFGLSDFTRTWFYKTTIDTTSLTSLPSYVQHSTNDLSVKEIIRRKYLGLSFSGRLYYLIKQRTWGTHCTKCWDEILQRISNPNCTECYGTGWVGGYFSAIPFVGMTNPSPKYNQIQMYGEWRPSDTMLTMLHYPKLSPKDIIVDDYNNRYIVNQIRLIEKIGFNFEQQAQLSLIAYDDSIYKVDPVPEAPVYTTCVLNTLKGNYGYYIADNRIIKNSIVYREDKNRIRMTKNLTQANSYKVAGIALCDASPGQIVSVMQNGTYITSNTMDVNSDIYLGKDGYMTQDLLNTNYTYTIGIPLTENTISIRI